MRNMLMSWLTFFFCTKPSIYDAYFTFAAFLSSVQPPFNEWGWWLPYETLQVWTLVVTRFYFPL